MTDAQAHELIAVVKSVLLPEIRGHPEADDMLGEAILKAFQVVEKMPGDSPYRWTTLAGRAAQWQAQEYLRSRRSGRLNDRRAGKAVVPVVFSNLPDGRLTEKADDGGIGEAEVRLQYWLMGKPLPAGGPLCPVCSEPFASRQRWGNPRRVYCSSRCKSRMLHWKRREAASKGQK